ncbi:MAG: GAF domain-containing protein [Anaerolineae bacterium]|nr:GAF domain-containing protein [Anaerolineae bacterium]
MMSSSLLALNAVRRQMDNTMALTIEMRSLAQDIQLEVESLQSLQNRLLNEYRQPGLDPLILSLPPNYIDISESLNGHTEQLLELSARLPDNATHGALQAQVDVIKSKANTSRVSFLNIIALVQQLSSSDSGTITRFRQSGEQLRTATARLNDASLNSQADTLRTLETVVIQSEASEDYIVFQQAIVKYQEIYESQIPEDRRRNEAELLQVYRENASSIVVQVEQIDVIGNTAQNALSDLRNETSRLNNVVEDRVGSPLDIMMATLNSQRIFLMIVMAVGIVASGFIPMVFGRDISRNLWGILDASRRISAGNLQTRISVEGKDEFSQLGDSFNVLVTQLDGLITGLEQRVAERTRELSITGDIGRAVVTLRDPRDLMNEIVELIRHRFGFYHAQIFLVDNKKENAVLTASTGTAGRELLARRHALSVGSQSVIGQVTSRGEPVIASDTDSSAVHRRNELLPDTRSEMALPMRIGDEVIGALDLQSVAPNAFDQDDVAVFQIMADQLAIALENARLHGELKDALDNIEMLERRITAEAWNAYRQSHDADVPLAYEFEDERIEPFTNRSPSPMGQAVRSGQLVSLDDGEDGISLAVPIKVRGEVIGAFGFGGETVRKLTGDDVALVEAVIDRVGLALENLRLMEQTARRAEHEQIINAITAKIVGTTDVNQILQTTVKELGRVLRAPQTSVQLRREKLDDSYE